MAIESVLLGRNLSRLELAATIVIIALLFGVFLDRMDDVEAAAEKAILRARYQDMQSRLMTLRTRFLTQGGAAAGTLRLDDVVRELGRGDVRFYDSEAAVDWQDLPPGSWVYVRRTRLLEYRVTHEDAFVVAAALPKRVRFQLEPRYADTNGNGRYDEGEERLDGATLRLLDPAALSPAAGR